MPRRSVIRAVLLLVLLAAIYAVRAWVPGEAGSQIDAPAGGDQAILDAFRDRQSGVVVEASGTVVRMLADDLEGSRHQRFVVQVAPGHTVLVSHNIDLAPRVDVGQGTPVRFRGQYEWNDRGGVVHWTHHDPAGRRPGGWIEADGNKVR